MVNSSKQQQFVRMVARLVKDREIDDNGDIFDMPNDDAVATLHALIDTARALTGTPDRLVDDGDTDGAETQEPNGERQDGGKLPYA